MPQARPEQRAHIRLYNTHAQKTFTNAGKAPENTKDRMQQKVSGLQT